MIGVSTAAIGNMIIATVSKVCICILLSLLLLLLLLLLFWKNSLVKTVSFLFLFLLCVILHRTTLLE
jgi:hypothetical protein